ncbi:PDR/VanB family oxidoreductase [Brevibacterium limosum]|uniref:PDR/VanB family oxidoreductase n=1 Tax=Brevibacterium limosum TaxID=2697565 RepID=UPI00141F8964|nr:PDR/VanB family oxidoreductase [Brevibacterium limosum]
MTKRIYTAGVYAERDMMLTLRRRDRIAEGVLQLEFVRSDGGPMPPWEPGAHIEIDVADIGIRHYSLIGDPKDREKWQIAVRLTGDDEAQASLYLHRESGIGDEFHVIAPRNNFNFASPTEGQRLHFIAGGIGITPLLSMIDSADASGVDWSLTYLGRTLESMPFRERLAQFGDRVQFVPSAARPEELLESLLAQAPAEARVYTCGPETLIDEVADISTRRGLTHRSELFAYSGGNGLREDDTPFELVCASSSLTVPVGESETIIEALGRHGIRARTSCQMGVCGTCETRVVDGVPDHRDSLLSEEEKKRGESMMICVGRALSDTLVVDL